MRCGRRRLSRALFRDWFQPDGLAHQASRNLASVGNRIRLVRETAVMADREVRRILSGFCDETDGRNRVKIAVIGGGIAGLMTAYRLCNSHQVTLFEANSYVGGHTNTVDIDIDDEHHAIDTGFIVFNDRTYPNFCRLLGELGVESEKTTMSFSVRCERTNLEYSGTGIRGLFAQHSNLLRPRFYRLLADWRRFSELSIKLFDTLDDSLTVGEFLNAHGFSRTFSELYFLPMGSAIWSCPLGTFNEFPIRFIIDFYRNHGLLSLRDRPQWRVVNGGSREYVRAMTRRFSDSIRTNSPVNSVRRHVTHVEVESRHGTESFDHVVLACHSDQALRMLADDASPTERDILSAFPYEKNKAVLHTDVSVLPKRRAAWASWNYHIGTSTSSAKDGAATVSYNMNILQHVQSKHEFIVTLNGTDRIDQSKILREFEYQHPVFTARRNAAQRRHSEILNQNRTSFCGAYWGNGFHEDGVNSAIAVCDAIGSECLV